MGRTTQAAEKEGARSFSRFVEQVDDGGALIAISEAMHKLLVEIKETADTTCQETKGALAVQFQFTANGGAIDVTYSIATKSPKRKFARSTFYLTAGANLSVENPRQLGLPLREVPEHRHYQDVESDNDNRSAKDV